MNTKQENLDHLEIEDNTLEKIKYAFERENPYSTPVEVPKYEIIQDDRISLSELNRTIQPFFTQLTMAHNRIEELTVEKVELACELKMLKERETELEEALDFSYQLLIEKEDVITTQQAEIEELTIKANKKWWKFWEW